MADISCELDINKEANFSARDAERLYKEFESAVENSLPELRYIRVAIPDSEEDGFLMTLTLNGDTFVYKNDDKGVSV